MTFESWITRALAITLAVSTVACDPDGGDVDAAEETADADDAEEEEAGEGDGDFRLFCPIFPGSAPSADVSLSLAGAPSSRSGEGAGTGDGCDRFTLGVTTPSGNRAHEVTFESIGDGYFSDGVDMVAGVWARSCTSGGTPLCTTWTSFPVDLDQEGGCWEVPIGINGDSIVVCNTTFYGSATLPANNTFTEVRAGFRVESSFGGSLTAKVTISE